MWKERRIRKYDRLNRIAIPKDWCKKLQFQYLQEVEAIMEYGKISIKKYENQDVTKLPYFGVLRSVVDGRFTIPAEYATICDLTRNSNIILELHEDKIQIYKECQVETF